MNDITRPAQATANSEFAVGDQAALTREFTIEDGWLIGHVDACTCGFAAFEEHTQDCGKEPWLNLAELAGWPGATQVQWEYGWAPHADSMDKFATQEQGQEAYSRAVGFPVRLWKRPSGPHAWVLA